MLFKDKRINQHIHCIFLSIFFFKLTQVVTSYFAWRVANGLHDDIYLHFMKPYHARCLVDGMFGIARRRIRRSDCDSIQNVKECVETSSPHNKVYNYLNKISTLLFLNNNFELPNINKFAVEKVHNCSLVEC